MVPSYVEGTWNLGLNSPFVFESQDSLGPYPQNCDPLYVEVHGI